MAIDVSTLSAYVDETNENLIGETVYRGETVKLLNLQVGVKGKAAINLLTGTSVFGDGSVCGWDDAGGVELSQRIIETGQIKLNTSFCEKDLINTWAGHNVKIAAGAKTLPFEEEFIDNQIQGVNNLLEIAIWNGDTDSLDDNLNKFDGLIKIIDAEAAVINATNTGITSITTSNVIGVIDNILSAIPAKLLNQNDLIIALGPDVFMLYVIALRNANMFHYSYNVDEGMQLKVPGTNITLKALPGLNGTSRLFAFRTSNIFYGTDLSGDEEKFEFWYSQDNREFRLAIEFNAGVQIAFPNEIVEFTLSV